jgi:SOS response regulatory protein OraA/RecX
VYSDEINWMEIIKKEFSKKFIIEKDFAKEDISRAKKFLLQRGFEFDQIKQLFK